MRMTKLRRTNRNKTIRALAAQHPDWTYELLARFNGVSAMTVYRAMKKETLTP